MLLVGITTPQKVTPHFLLQVGAAGIGRIGINDISDGNGGQLLNISTRCYIGPTSAQYLFAGFQVRDGNTSIVIQGFGPSRANSDALADQSSN